MFGIRQGLILVCTTMQGTKTGMSSERKLYIARSKSSSPAEAVMDPTSHNEKEGEGGKCIGF